MKPAVLYISYDGILEPLGQSQVLEYLCGLAPRFRILLVSFEKPEDWRQSSLRRSMMERVARVGIEWHPLRYHRSPSVAATSFDVAQGIATAVRLARRERIEIVHARSYVASIIALALKRALGVKFIFDMRGFWADERVEGGSWTQRSPIYRVAKGFEKRFIQESDAIVSLTHAGVDAIRRMPFANKASLCFRVITTCTNCELFYRSESRSSEPFVLGYVGNVAGSYVFEPVLEVFRHIQRIRPGARLRILNRDSHERIRSALEKSSIRTEAVDLIAASRDAVPGYIQGFSASAYFLKPSFSKLASAPTKLGELLACGVPCLINAGIGDQDRIVAEDQVGVVLERLTPSSVQDGAAQLVKLASSPNIGARCADSARRRFNLKDGIEAYGQLYDDLLSEEGLRPSPTPFMSGVS